MKHTKTPWKISNDTQIIDVKGNIVAQTLISSEVPSFENAEFIVRAVNIHYKLLEALKKSHACATIQEDGSCGGCFVSEAIANAEGDK